MLPLGDVFYPFLFLKSTIRDTEAQENLYEQMIGKIGYMDPKVNH